MFRHCHQEIDRLSQFVRFLQEESVVHLDLGFSSHDLLSVEFHVVGCLPVFDDVEDVVDARVRETELATRPVDQLAPLQHIDRETWLTHCSLYRPSLMLEHKSSSRFRSAT